MSELNFEDAKQRTLNLLCKFTDAERAEKGEILADKRIRMDEIKEEVSELNKEKSDLDKELLQISRQLKHGGEKRFVKCLVHFNHPKDSEKTIRRTDTSEEWTEEMTDSDYSLLSELKEEPEELTPLLLLPEASIESMFGFDPKDFDYFIGNTLDDFADNDIDIPAHELRIFGRCLYVKASFTDIRELVGPDISWNGYFHTDINNVYWYRFLPLREPDGTQTVEEAEVIDGEIVSEELEESMKEVED